MAIFNQLDVIRLINKHLQSDTPSLSDVAQAFSGLPQPDKVKTVGQLRIRNGEVGDKLISLLFELTKTMKCSAPVALGITQEAWRERKHEAGFAESVRRVFCELRFC